MWAPYGRRSSLIERRRDDAVSMDAIKMAVMMTFLAGAINK